MVVAVAKAMEEGARGGDLRLDRQHLRLGGRLRGALRPARATSSCRRATIALGKLAQALDARRAGSSRSTATSTTRCAWRASAASATRVALVNSVNPHRIEGQKTAAFEICRRAGRRARLPLFIPVGNAGNITAYWRGFQEYHAAALTEGLPRDAGLPGGRRRADRPRPRGRGARRRSRRRSASATRRAGTAPTAARDESGGAIDAVERRRHPRGLPPPGADEGVFCEPASAISLAGALSSAPAASSGRATSSC